MKEYNFTLRFKTNQTVDNKILDELYRAGCDDALIGLGEPMYITLDFSREAPSDTLAIQSAILDVKSALPKADLVQVLR